jgi:K+-transporting ATPase ATPase C chain
MTSSMRATLWLTLSTLLLCAVLYPLLLLGIGQALFRNKAQGSLVMDEDGKVIGSRLLAQPFTADETFWPRPSAASYNGASSGASNWGGSNYLLRNRVARQLGPIVRYGEGAEKFGGKPGELVGPDIEKWFRVNRYGGKEGIVAQWFELHGGLAEAWVKDVGDALKGQTEKDKPGEAFVAQWQKDQPASYRRWRQANPDQDSPEPADLAKPFFEGFLKDNVGFWPVLEDEKVGEKTIKKIGRTREGAEIQSVFFDLWRQDHAEVPLEEVAADMVMASGSGLDPHITLDNARYQLKYRVAGAWTDKLIKDRKIQADETRKKEIRDRVHKDIVQFLNDHASAPLGGLVGVPLVNVLEVNLALRDRMRELGEKIR